MLGAQEGDWEEVEGAIRAFQQMSMSIKFCPRPVVVAPFNLTLGGGAEISLHAARRQPYAETYIGLVETGIGLIPGGGGTKEMLLRAVDSAAALAPPDPKDPPSRFAQSAEMNCGAEALARDHCDGEGVDLRRRSASPGTAAARRRHHAQPRTAAAGCEGAGDCAGRGGLCGAAAAHVIPAPGTASLAVLNTGVFLMGEAGFASEHDMKVARWVAYILCGGKVTAGSLVSEQYLLDLEREAFLSLCGERKTQERVAYTLKTGKPLRN